MDEKKKCECGNPSEFRIENRGFCQSCIQKILGSIYQKNNIRFVSPNEGGR